MQLRQRLLHHLCDGEYHSGEALGRAVGISRMAVWKHVSALREAGLALEVRRGKGYRLPAPVEFLDHERIRLAVAPQARPQLETIEILTEVDSTNNHLRKRAQQGAAAGSVCLAERQLCGRGRRGRSWVSPFATNLYLSLLWRSAGGAAALGGLSLVSGIALVRCLHRFGIASAGLKWPNDVLVDGAKLAGILIDIAGESTGPCAVIIGIGVNVRMPPAAAAQIDQAWTDLYSQASDEVSRNELAGCLLGQLLPVMAQFEAHGLQPFMDEWRSLDVVQGRSVDVRLPDALVSGRACGIDAGGALLVDTAAGRRRFVSGEVSLRITP